MHVFLGLLMAVVGALSFQASGLILGGLIGILAAEVLSLRKRLALLEKREEAVPEHAARRVAPEAEKPRQAKEVDKRAGEEETEEDIIFAPEPPEPQSPPLRPPASSPGTPTGTVTQPSVSAIDRFFGSLGSSMQNRAAKIIGFFTSGNVVLKIGIIILFFGMAFLLKYAAQRNMVPIELRLAGVAVSGMGMLGLGWRLRSARLNYGLLLQGGGVGILYLVVFAAAKLYHLLPAVVALAVMVGLVGLSCLLAVLQDSRALAVSGIVGGFLAPVLMSSGGGSHVLLFSYYAILNAGICGIAWAKAWRELNLIGFFFTFSIGTLWGASGYRPELFITTEPFLLIFFGFYVLISILFAHRQPVNLRGYIDGPLVFGLPLVVSGLQYYLVRNFDFGMAFSALGLGFFYLTLAAVLWRRLKDSMHLLSEAFLALGVVFGSLAIPLAFDGHLSSAIWALEGAGLVWVGARQQRVLARHFGILLQFSAAVIFVDSVWYPLGGVPFVNSYFFGCILFSVAALASGWFLDRHEGQLRSWERLFPLPLLIWGLVWWYVGGLQEVDTHLARRDVASGFLIYCTVSSILQGLAVKYLPWPRLALALLLQLPAMVLLALVDFIRFYPGSHLMAGWRAVVWVMAFTIQYRLLALFGDLWPKKNEIAWHLVTLWLLLFIASEEMVWAVDRIAGIGRVWAAIGWGVVPSLGLLFLVKMTGTELWPLGKFGTYYLGAGGLLPAASLALYVIASCADAGNPFPLRYLPLVNPLELSALLAIFTVFLWLLNIRRRRDILDAFPKNLFYGALGVLLFLFFNSTVARTVHFFAGIPYTPYSLYRSVVFQAALAALWGVGALAITVWATRRGSRLGWSVGAALLALVVTKLFLVDLSGTGTIARIVSFLVVGVLMLIIGYLSPLPPKKKEDMV